VGGAGSIAAERLLAPVAMTRVSTPVDIRRAPCGTSFTAHTGIPVCRTGTTMVAFLEHADSGKVRPANMIRDLGHNSTHHTPSSRS
jgi:hypothetical protein